MTSIHGCSRRTAAPVARRSRTRQSMATPTPQRGQRGQQGDQLEQRLLALGIEQHHHRPDQREEHREAQPPAVETSPCGLALPRRRDDEARGPSSTPAPKSRARVLLHPAGLDCRRTTGLAGACAEPLTAPSTTPWSTYVVDDRRRAEVRCADGVHDAVDHVLVEPVGARAIGALDAADDDVGVEVVEVVLVLEERVAGAGQRVPLVRPWGSLRRKYR